MKQGRAATIIAEVQAAVRRWPEFAVEARLSDEWCGKIKASHRLTFPQRLFLRSQDPGHDLRHVTPGRIRGRLGPMNSEPASGSPESPPPASPRRGRLVAGGVMLAVALVALAGPYLPVAWDRPFLLVAIGLGFLIWGALGRVGGLLVPAGVLLGVGFGAWLRGPYGNAAYLLSLAAGFLSISLFYLLIFGRKGQVWWTVWPAGGLALAAAFTAGGPEVRAFFRALHEYWPWALLAAAVAMIVSGLRARS